MYTQVSILTRSARAARAMGGAQWISCKSAKDRTSMLCTYEAAQLLAAAGAVFSDMPPAPPAPLQKQRKMSLRPNAGPLPSALPVQAACNAELTPAKARWHKAAAKLSEPHAAAAARPAAAARKPSLMALTAKVAVTRQVFERGAADEVAHSANTPLLSRSAGAGVAASDEPAQADTVEASVHLALLSAADAATSPPPPAEDPVGDVQPEQDTQHKEHPDAQQHNRKLEQFFGESVPLGSSRELASFEPVSPTAMRHRIDSAVHPLGHVNSQSSLPVGVSEDETFDSSERPVLSLANHLREHGVRLRNCQLNVGKAQYAFNKLQVSALPRELKPPLSVIKTGKLES